MEQIEAAISQKMKKSGSLNEKQMEKMEGVGKDLTVDRGQREDILRWFVETQAVSVLFDGSFPPWFQGFISRQEAEDKLRDKSVGCFLIRLSEKAIGYILSYKGHDRCRHFVINQTKTGQFVVSGDSIPHSGLTELIYHFKTTPIQPFGEYLTSYNTDSVGEDPTNELYDVVQSKPIVNLGVSVKALRSLWEQTCDVAHGTPPVLSTKSGRKLTTCTSFDRNSLSQDTKNPPVPKKTAPLRNSLSAGFAGTHPSHEQHSFSEPKTSGRSGVDETVNGRRRSNLWDTEGSNSQLKWTENSYIPTTSIKTTPKKENWNRSLLFQDENTEEPQSLTNNPCNPMPSSTSQPPLLPPNTAFSSYAVLDFKKPHNGAGQLPYTGQVALQPNSLYQTSSGMCAGQEDQPEPDCNIHAKTIYNTLLVENPYQVIPDQCDNDSYEHIPEIQENNTYEDIPGIVSDTYASLEEIQPHRENTWGKKNQKWWKFRPESWKK
ncbi:uncharacterized protein sh2d7 [Myxocyprinus asiaticus]|uniref:uncharacterized protein sh2d7 n=1 Tax=Myxocyprinus asiaticus TaxID=70543 RepID=UPI0022239521|nr:uncharacterized protein sh2d7 [Myxocyprinus asiaticus]